MLLTHSFVAAVTPGWYQYIFYVIEGGYYDHRKEFIAEFQRNIESLGRALGDQGVVVAPFRPDIPAVTDEISFKQWTERERTQIQRTPSLLVLTKDLAEFSPRSDPWLLLHFDEDQYSGSGGYNKLKNAFAAIAEAVVGPDAKPERLYEVARKLAIATRSPEHVFQAKPGIWGFSVDLVQVGEVLRAQLKGRRRKIGRWPRRQAMQSRRIP